MINFFCKKYRLNHFFITSGLFLFSMVLVLGCGLPEVQSVLTAPTVAVVDTTATISRSEEPNTEISFYGVSLYYKIYHNNAGNIDNLSLFNDDFTQWDNTFGNPSTAATNTKYTPLFTESLDANHRNPTVSIFNSKSAWNISLNMKFEGVNPPIRIDHNGTTLPYFRKQLRDLQARKTFSVGEIVSGEVDYPVTGIANSTFCVGLIAYVFAQDIGATPQYSRPVKVGLFNIP